MGESGCLRVYVLSYIYIVYILYIYTIYIFIYYIYYNIYLYILSTVQYIYMYYFICRLKAGGSWVGGWGGCNNVMWSALD